MDTSIRFPHLGIEFSNVGKSVSVFGINIAFYGIIIACAMVLGLLLAMRVAKWTKQDPDLYFDAAIFAIPSALIGARIYYVIFSWDQYKDQPLHIFYLREGGLAILGGVIAAFLALLIFARVRKQKLGRMADVGCLGLLLGQIIGRWGNFFNREAFGDYTDGLFAMQLPLGAVRSSDVTERMMEHLVEIDGVSYIQVHPTFLYESLWNALLLIALLLYTKHKKFDGEVFLLYLLGYGVGRTWIEALRTDQLLLPGLSVPVSQLLSVLMAAAAVVLIAVFRWRGARKKTGEADDTKRD